jgi:hypothetical protein
VSREGKRDEPAVLQTPLLVLAGAFIVPGCLAFGTDFVKKHDVLKQNVKQRGHCKDDPQGLRIPRSGLSRTQTPPSFRHALTTKNQKDSISGWKLGMPCVSAGLKKLVKFDAGYLLDLMCAGDSGSYSYENSIYWQ